MTGQYVLDTNPESTYVGGTLHTADSGGRNATTQVGNNLNFTEVNIPAEAVAGQTVTVTGHLYLDALVSITEVATRVVVSSPELGEKVQDTGKLGAGEGATFSVDLPAPTEPGQQVNVSVKAQVNPPDYIPLVPSGWQTKAQTDIQSVNIVTKRQKQTSTALSYAPWVAGGTGAGFLLSKRTQTSPRVGALTGAAVGAGARQVTGGQLQVPDVTPDISAFEAAGYAALLGSAAWLLTSTQDFTGVGEGTGGLARSAGRAVETARRKVPTPRLSSGGS